MKAAIAFAKALADPTRLRVVAALRDHELSVCELCDALETTQSTLSTHLTLLRDAGLVQTRKEGRWIYYGLSADVAPLTESFFQHFADAIHDKRIRRDAERVHRRLQLREDGCCTLGFNQLGSKRGNSMKKILLLLTIAVLALGSFCAAFAASKDGWLS